MPGRSKSYQAMKRRYGRHLEEHLAMHYNIDLATFKKYASTGEPDAALFAKDLKADYDFIEYRGFLLYCGAEMDEYEPAAEMVKAALDDRLGGFSYDRTYKAVLELLMASAASPRASLPKPHVAHNGSRNDVETYEITGFQTVRAYRRKFQVILPDCQTHGPECVHYQLLSVFLRETEEIGRVRQVFNGDPAKWGHIPGMEPEFKATFQGATA